MNLNEYQVLAMRTSPEGHDRLKNGVLGLIGETGEIVDVVKKWKFQSGDNAPLPRESLINEMGDVMWYLSEAASGMGVPLNDALLLNGKPVFLDVKEDIEEIAVTMAQSACAVYSLIYPKPYFMLAQETMRDIFGLILWLCKMIDTTVKEVADTNIAKLKARYPEGFDPERSIHRPEYKHMEQTEEASQHLFEVRNRTI